MISFILLAVSLLPSQTANTTCADTGPITATAQTQPVQGPDGTSAVLKVSTADDHSKNSHECSADYQLLITPAGGGAPTLIDVDTVDGSYGREMSFRLDGFSRDGKHIFGVLSEGGKWPIALLFDYDAVAKVPPQLIDLKEVFAGLLPVACRSTLRVGGTTQSGAIVLDQDSSGACGAARRWMISPAGGKPQAVSPGVATVGLYGSNAGAK